MNNQSQGRRKNKPTARTEFKRKTYWLGQTDSAPGPAQPVASGADLEKRIQHYLREKIARVIHQTPKEVSAECNFMDLGLDSVNMIGAVYEIEKEIGLALYPTLFFEYQNIAALAGYFSRENAGEFSAHFGLSAAAGILSAPRQPDRTPARSGSIAIIGMSGRLARAENLREFWQHLQEDRDLIEEVPQDHWDYRPWFDNDRNAINKTYAKWGSFIRDVDKFDPGFFGISPRQADWMDPQLRLLLQCAQEAFEDAGIINRVQGSRTGVYVGSCFKEYWDEIVRAQIPIVDYQAHSAALSSLSGTISYIFDLQGGSIPLDNACASSLTALHLGCQALENGECEQALVAGVNLLLSPLHYVYFSRLQALSPSGRCHTFDRKADGYVPGEGVVAVLIKPLPAALADGDNIHAVIRGTAINHVGRSNNPYSPRPELQTKLLLDAWQKAAIDPRRLTYLEAHGTGTSLGDPIEINALKAAFKQRTRECGFCAIGSAKAHIGHLEGAAGLASLVKVVLMMQHRTIPRMPNFEALNPYIKLDDSPFYVNTEQVEWHSENGPLLAGVSSFGLTGNNAHVVLEAYAAVSHSEPMPSYLVPLSAKSEPQLKRYAEKLHAYLAAEPAVNLTDLAYTLQTGRQAFAHRAMFFAQTREQLQERLQKFMAAGAAETNAGFVYGACASEPEPDDRFASGEDYRNSMAQWFRDDHPKLAQHWAQGLAIEWDALYAAAGRPQPQRITLPTYPFAQQRYWMKVENAAPPPPASPVWTDGQKTTAAEFALRPARIDRAHYALHLQGDAFFLRDHKVRAQKVLPGVACLEAARAAVEMETGQAVAALNSVVWVQPLAVEDAAKEVAIHLSPVGGGIHFIVSTGAGSTTHCQGSAVTAKAVCRPPALELEPIRKACRSRAEAESIYARFRQQGLEYGESFRAIDHLQYSDSQALALIQLPAHLAAQTHGCLLHPSIADAALQSILGLTLGAVAHADTAVTLLPFSVRRIDFHAPTPVRAYAYARYAEGTDNRGSLLQYDVTIADENGNVCVVFNGFTCRALREGEPLPEPAEENLARWVDETLRGFVSDILKIEPDYISIDEEMSAYGMDSITLTELGNTTSRHFDIDLLPTVFFEHNTLELFRDYLIDTCRPALLRAFPGAAQTSAADASRRHSELELLSRGRRIPVFWFHAALGTVQNYIPVARSMGSEVTFYGVQSRAVRDNSEPVGNLRALAQGYSECLLDVHGNKPLHLGGYSQGGALAYEVARILQQRGSAIKSLVLVDTPFPPVEIFLPEQMMYAQAFVSILHLNGKSLAGELQELLREIGGGESYIERALTLAGKLGLHSKRTDLAAALEKFFRIVKANTQSMHTYTPEPLPRPQEPECHYFQRRSAARFFSPAFTVSEEMKRQNAYFGANACAQKWRALMPLLQIHATGAADHFSMLEEGETLAKISAVCRPLYCPEPRAPGLKLERAL